MAATVVAPSPLDQVEAAFKELVRGPGALCLDGRELGPDVPQRPLALDELRSCLLQAAVSFETRDRALATVVRRAHHHGEAWMLGLAGLLMPGLRSMARRLEGVSHADRAEVEAEILAAAVDAVGWLGTDQERIAARVCWRAYRRAHRGLCVGRLQTCPLSELDEDEEEELRAVDGSNPERFLARAVRAGVITAEDAELIAVTRLDGRGITELAAARGMPATCLQQRRYRAEARVADLLRDHPQGLASDPGCQSGFLDRDMPRPGARRSTSSRYQTRPGRRIETSVARPPGTGSLRVVRQSPATSHRTERAAA